MEKRADLAIIGAGTAGITAFMEASKITKNILIINSGPYGTTCARIGCMPSKAFIQIAKDFYRRRLYPEYGIAGSDGLTVSIPMVMKRVRELRDHFVSGIMETMDKIGDKNIQGTAKFIEPNVLEVDGELKIIADKTIIATGAEPVFPPPWKEMGEKIITTDTFFEEADLPSSMGIIGLGVIGLELGQAISRLGVEVTGMDGIDFIGGLSDPEVNRYAVDIFKDEMDINLHQMADLKNISHGIEINLKGNTKTVGKILASIGRRPRLSGLNLDKIGIKTDARGMPEFDPMTLQIKGFPIFIAGDAGGERPLLHEAVDGGRIAGYNASRKEPVPFKRRAVLSITFCDPNIASAGKRFSELKDNEIIIGEARFESQGRSVIMGENRGLLRIYGEPGNGKILGAEMIAPAGEHLAHHLAWCIQAGMNVFDVLSMPFYHPVVEEGLQNALKDLARKVKGPKPENDLMRHLGHPV